MFLVNAPLDSLTLALYVENFLILPLNAVL